MRVAGLLLHTRAETSKPVGFRGAGFAAKYNHRPYTLDSSAFIVYCLKNLFKYNLVPINTQKVGLYKPDAIALLHRTTTCLMIAVGGLL